MVRIVAPHEVTDPAKVQHLAEQMREHGWQGEPVLVVRHGDGYQAWTGTHRLAAAGVAGIEPAIYVWEMTGEQDEYLSASACYDSAYSRPLDEGILSEMVAMGDVDPEAIRLYRAEVEKHG